MRRVHRRGGSLHDLLADYRKEYMAGARAERDGYAGVPLEDVIVQAGMGKRADGSHHPHLYRVPTLALRQGVTQMLIQMNAIRACSDFDTLHGKLARIAQSINGLGKLWVYDTALALAGCLALAPREIYLHAGTAEGARALGVRPRKRWHESDWPQEFIDSGLTADDLENFLCIYRRQLEVISSKKGHR